MNGSMTDRRSITGCKIADESGFGLASGTKTPHHAIGASHGCIGGSLQKQFRQRYYCTSFSFW
jgi:hypothetical protein